MQDKLIKPYGYWPSELSSELLASNSLRLSTPLIWQESVVWLQNIPEENGRTSLMGLKDNKIDNLLPAPWDIRSKAHEYGGGAYTVCDNAVYFVNADDQDIYRYLPESNQAPEAITSSVHQRFADLHIVDNRWLYAVCESFAETDETEVHHDEPLASIVAINVDTKELITLVTGEDFYSGLALNQAGNSLAYISWNHPNMPWDATNLWQLEWEPGNSDNLKSTCVKYGKNESIVQPGFSPDGELYYISDASNWWNLYKASSASKPLCRIEAEFATPQWVFGMKNWGFLTASTILYSSSQNGIWSLGYIDINTGELSPIDSEYCSLESFYCSQHTSTAVFIAASPAYPPRVVRYQNNKLTPLTPLNTPLKPEDISKAISFYFPTTNDEQAHLWFYPPTNTKYQAKQNDKPPLIVIGHGGPTGATNPALNLKIQFWTQRGFAVADVNYRGSTGFGRAYRSQLENNWGIKDVDDLCQAALFLVTQDLVDSEQKYIKGSSAGGYSVLAALTMHDVFDAGVSLYGIADLHTLATDTHKFEARYLDRLIGPYPEAKDIYTDRSPINHIDNLNCPILIAQGLDDKVVPYTQAELIVNAARNKQIPVTYLPFAGEGHGFRFPETLKTLFAQELTFYQALLESSSTAH